MSHRIFHRLLPALAVALAFPGGGGSAAQEGSERRAILAVGVERGREAAEALDPGELTVTAGGTSLEVLGVGSPEDLHGRWQVVIWVDQALTGTRSIYRLLETLAGQAAALTRLGEVQLVVAGDEDATVVRTSDPILLEQVLTQQSLRSAGEHVLREQRLRLVEALEDETTDAAELASAALEGELDIVRRRADELVAWVAAQGRAAGPRALVLLSEGVGLEPLAFYGAWLEEGAAAIRSAGGVPDVDSLGRVLASRGWTLVPTIVPPDPEDEEGLSLRTNRSIGFRLRLGGGDDDEDDEREAVDLALDAGRRDALASLAEVTGGEIAEDLTRLPTVLAGLARRLPVEIARPPVAGDSLPLQLAATGERRTIRAPHWLGGSPEAIAETRIRRSLEGDGDPGELPIRARIHLDADRLDVEPAELDLLVDLSSWSHADSVPLRISVGVHLQHDELLVSHSLLEADPSSEPTFALRRPLSVPPSTDAAIVVVENLADGSWGETFAEFLTTTAAEAEATASVPEVAPRGPAGPALLLEPLPAEARTGKVRVRTQTRDDVDEVVFLLDGERVGSRRRAPYDLRIDLGDLPAQHSIIAIAYDRDGTELGRDGLVVNEAATSFWVQITEPASGERVGPVDIETRFKLPEEGELERVEYFWNDELVGTTHRAPHTQRLLIPVDRPAGYIRVVATLSTGKTAEDVVLMNTRRFESQITVELVELYVVVTDRGGKPILGLDREDFVIREENEVQDIESFAVAGGLPLTLGLAIDSSLSLFKRLPEVQAAASHFVAGLRADRDRAFLVEYGSRPRLVQPVTADLERIDAGIRSLEPSGSTAVWEAVALSLRQLQETVGRRALVVFYDGDDEDEEYSFKKTLDLARQSRIPIYLIVMNNEAARTEGKGFSVRSRVARLEQLARTGGGRVFWVRTDQDLSPIFAEIGQELRSHYLLTYYPQRPVEEPDWRPITVELRRSDLTARTISGYGGG